MIAGYHTGGLLFHDLVVVIEEIARMGYQSIAIRPHGASLNPQFSGFGQQLLRLGDSIRRSGVRCVLDLDSPYLPDPYHARGPSLVSTDDEVSSAAYRWISNWVSFSGDLGAELITFSSGSWEGSGLEPDQSMLERLSSLICQLADEAANRDVRLALHPRRGDAVATVAQFERLGQWIEAEVDLLLAADIGEMLAAGELPVADRLARNLEALACVYLCDRRAGVEGDQPIGHGDVALGRILQSLRQNGFQGHGIVRVEGHSILGFGPAQEAIQIF